MEKRLCKTDGSSVILNTSHIIDLAYTVDGRVLIRTDILKGMSINNKVEGLDGFRTYYKYEAIEVKESDNPDLLDGLRTQKVKNGNKGIKKRLLNIQFMAKEENGVVYTSVQSYCDQKDNSNLEITNIKFG